MVEGDRQMNIGNSHVALVAAEAAWVDTEFEAGVGAGAGAEPMAQHSC